MLGSYKNRAIPTIFFRIFVYSIQLTIYEMSNDWIGTAEVGGDRFTNFATTTSQVCSVLIKCSSTMFFISLPLFINFFLNGPSPASFSFTFVFSKHILQFLQ